MPTHGDPPSSPCRDVLTDARSPGERARSPGLSLSPLALELYGDVLERYRRVRAWHRPIDEAIAREQQLDLLAEAMS